MTSTFQGRTVHNDEQAELKRQLAELIEENIRLKAAKAAGERALIWKVSEKGAISIYGMGRWPLTLYKSQWDKLYAVMDDIQLFRDENDKALASKE